MGNPSKYTVQIAVGFTVFGLLLIVLGWNGAASLDRVPGQMPYLISGGIAGLALVAVGLVLALVQELRRATREVSRRLDQMGEMLAAGVAPAPSAGPTAVPSDGSHIVAGRTTYHRPDCRMIAERHDLQHMSAGDAVDRGLAPCRICEPEAQAV